MKGHNICFHGYGSLFLLPLYEISNFKLIINLYLPPAIRYVNALPDIAAASLLFVVSFMPSLRRALKSGTGTSVCTIRTLCGPETQYLLSGSSA